MALTKAELADFEAYLEPDFEPFRYANDLLLATNDNEDSELDLSTSIKRLKFDIDECDKRMKAISVDNYESLISNFTKIEDTKAALRDHINPQIERVNTSFTRIKSNVIEPFDNALKLNNAMKRIHSTLNLFRGSSYFIFLVQQLQESEKVYDSLSVESNNKEVIRLARLQAQLTQFYDREKKVNHANMNSSLMSIKYIRDFQPIHTSKKATLVSELSQEVSTYLNRHNAATGNLQNGLMALYILSEKDFRTTIEKLSISKQVQNSLSQLTRSLQSPRNFNVVLKDIKESSKEYLRFMNETLTACEIKPTSDSQKHIILLEVVKSHFDSKTIEQVFWSDLSLKFKKNIVATMARGGPIAKNLKVYQSGIKNSINEIFDAFEAGLLTEAINFIQK